MDVNVKVKDNLIVRAFYLIFIINSIQTGVGIMGAPKHIFLEAGRDSWLSILIAWAYMLVIVFVMFKILNQYKNADLFGIQVDVFGTWIGKLLGSLFILYIATSLLSVLVTYIEVVQIFIFPNIKVVTMATVLLALVIYSVRGGIRVIVGVVFIFFILTVFYSPILIHPTMRMDMTHFLPPFQASFKELLLGAKATTYSFIGFEILLIVYPFIQNKKDAKLPAYLGVSLSAILILGMTVISIGYFSPKQIESIDWTVLSLFKTVSFSFLERFDYVIVAEWMMVVIPNMILLMWIITYGVKRLYKVPQKTTLYIASILILIFACLLNSNYAIQKTTDMVAKVGIWIVFVYPLLLLPLVLLKKRWRKKKDETKS